jgi:hypothetical protein
MLGTSANGPSSWIAPPGMHAQGVPAASQSSAPKVGPVLRKASRVGERQNRGCGSCNDATLLATPKDRGRTFPAYSMCGLRPTEHRRCPHRRHRETPLRAGRRGRVVCLNARDLLVSATVPCKSQGTAPTPSHVVEIDIEDRPPSPSRQVPDEVLLRHYADSRTTTGPAKQSSTGSITRCARLWRGSPTSGSSNSHLTENNPYPNKPFLRKLGRR